MKLPTAIASLLLMVAQAACETQPSRPARAARPPVRCDYGATTAYTDRIVAAIHPIWRERIEESDSLANIALRLNADGTIRDVSTPKGLDDPSGREAVAAARPDGRVHDAIVLASEPEGVFEDAALAAFRQWQWEPKAGNSCEVRMLLDFDVD